MKEVSIFEYYDVYTYLNDIYKIKKEKNHLFSIRAWGNKIGFPSSSTLTDILKHRRKINKTNTVRLIKNLSLTDSEAVFFESLVDYSKESSPESLSYISSKLERLRKRNQLDILKLASFEYMSSPLVLLLFEMISLKKFRNNLKWINKHTLKEYQEKEIESALEVLKKLKLITIGKDNIIVKTKNGFSYSFDDPIDKASEQFHKTTLSLISGAVGSFPNSEAKTSSYFFNVEQSRVESIIEEIRLFNTDLINKYEAKHKEGDQTYLLNIHFLPVSKT